jgi:hypothetical protein
VKRAAAAQQLPIPALSPAARSALAAGVIVLATLVAHAPLGRASYVQDDHLAVERNEAVARGDLDAIFLGSYWEGARGEDRTLYRPVTILSFALERSLTGSPDPFVSHLVNVLLHALASLALAALARRIGASQLAASGAGLLFALHPVLTEAVANVVGRSEILAALFTLGALLAQTRTGAWEPRGAPAIAATGTRQRVAAWAAAALVFLALGSKETAIAGVGLLVALELLFRPPASGGIRPWLVDRGAALAPVALAVSLHVILRIRALQAVLLAQTVPVADNPLVSLDGAERLATALAIAARYARLLLLPVRLSADYSGNVIETEHGLRAPRPLGGFLFLAAWILLAALPLLFALRRAEPAGRGPVPALARQVSFSATLFLLPYLVIGNLLFRVGAGMAERFLYSPTAGYCLLLAVLMGRLVEGEIAFVSGSLSQLRRVVGLAFALLLAGFAIQTASRCLEWRSDRTVFEAAARVNPASPRAHYIVATLDSRDGKAAEALRGIDVVLRLWPEYLPAWVEKGTLLGQQGDFAEAEAAAREAVRIGPFYGRAHSVLGLTLHRLGRLSEAERSLRKAVLWEPALDQAWAELGNVLFEQRRYARAADAYARAAALGRSAVNPRLKEARRLAGA